MAPKTRPKKNQKKTDLIKCQKRREQVKMAMRKYRQKLSEEQLEERRRKDKERYKKKKGQGLIKGINELPIHKKEVVRRSWKESSRRYRERKKCIKQIRQQAEEFTENEIPPDSPKSSSSLSTAESGEEIQVKEKRILQLENILLKEKLHLMEMRLKKYKTHYYNKKLKATHQETETYKETCEISDTKEQIEEFLEQGECSRLSAGNKKTTRNKKGNKRLLNDPLLNNPLLNDPLLNNPLLNLHSNFKQRNICLCIHHKNMELIITALKTAKIINERTPISLVKSICCEGKLQENCLLRKCNDCKNKKPQINETEHNKIVSYFRWITKKCPVIIRGSEKMTQKTIKEKVLSPKKDLINLMLPKLPDFMIHLNNIYHQYQAVKLVKQQVNEETAILHIDVAENYVCKYAEEVQAAHFGDSKPQISLHTAILYHHGEAESRITPFCTISENLRHDPVLICNHLLPLLKMIKSLHPNLKTIHLISDSSSLQYRNKSMFFLMANFLAVSLNVQSLLWHYDEAVHGKDSLGGIGASVKRTADHAFSSGSDVSNFQELIEYLIKNCKGIQIIPVDDQNVTSVENLLTRSLTPTFKGTQNIHQITWAKDSPNFLHARKLSCMECLPNQICPHYEIGFINTKPMENNLYESEVLPTSPSWSGT